MDIELVEQLVRMLEASASSELKVAAGGLNVTIRRPPGAIETFAEPEPKADVQAPSEPGESQEPSAMQVLAPMVGIFRMAEGIVEGVEVTSRQTIGYIESMKLMNEVPSGHSGVLSTLAVEDGAPVEFGQLLAVIEEER